MHIRVIAALCLLGLLTPSAATAKTYQLAPSGPWHMDYDIDSCRLTRAFGEGDDKVVAQFVRYEPSDEFDFNLIGTPLKTRDLHPTVAIRFGAIGEPVKRTALTGQSGNVPALFIGSTSLKNIDSAKLDFNKRAALEPAAMKALSYVPPQAETMVKSVSVQLKGTTISLDLVSMGKPMAEMRKCTADLVKEWGLDPAQQAALISQATAASDPQGWLKPADFPKASLKDGAQAIVTVRMMVDSSGLPTSCAIQSSIGDAIFKTQSCALLMQRARFKPAIAANGTAVPSYYVTHIRWIITEPDCSRLAPNALSFPNC